MVLHVLACLVLVFGFDFYFDFCFISGIDFCVEEWLCIWVICDDLIDSLLVITTFCGGMIVYVGFADE